MIEKESFGTFSEQNSVENEPVWVNTYYRRQEISNPLIDFCVLCAGFIFIVIAIPACVATIIVQFLPGFPALRICCGLGMAAFIWLLYRMKHGDCMESVTVGNDGITIRQKSGQIMQYTRGQVLNIDMHRMTNRGATMLHFYYINVMDDSGKKKEIPFNFLSDDDMARLIRDIEKMKSPKINPCHTGRETGNIDNTDDTICGGTYTYAKNKFFYRVKMQQRIIAVILVVCVVFSSASLAFRLYQYHGNPPFDIWMMFVFMLFGVAFVDLLFWAALYSKYKSYYPKMISKIELLEEGIGITQENKTYILANEIRCIKIHAPGFKLDRKSGIRKMTIKTVGNEVVCYLGFHPNTNKKLVMSNYEKLYKDLFLWASKHRIECLNDRCS